MKKQTRAIQAALTGALLCAAAGCGSNAANETATLSGVTTADAPVGGAKLTLQDASSPAQVRTAEAAADGTFSFDVTGLQPPFALRADWTDATGSHELRSVADHAGHAHIDPMTESAVAAAVAAIGGGAADEDARTAALAASFLDQLRGALAPLLERYAVGADFLQTDPAALLALFRDVQFGVKDGALVVTNRASGAVILTVPLADLAAGAFHPESMPAGPSTTPTPTPT